MKTFAELIKKSKINQKTSKATTLQRAAISPELVLLCLNYAKSHEDMTVEYVLGHKVGPVPTCPFHEDGKMHRLEETVEVQMEHPKYEKSNLCLLEMEWQYV